MAGLEIVGLTKTFGPIVAVRDLHLSVERGEFVCLLGPSGAGKTTTLRCVAGLERPDRGRILMDGVDVTMLAPRDRNVAMVFQNYALYPHLTVFENLAYPLRESRTPYPEIERRVKEVAEKLYITHTLERRPPTLSGGEMQRVAIGRAIIRRCELFLFDEPLTNLDAKLRHEMRVELKKLQRELGQTLLYATPDQLEAISMGDRVAVINQGVLQQYATPHELYEHPRNAFVATFVGDPPMNMVEASLESHNGDLHLDCDLGLIKAEGWVEPLRKVNSSGLIWLGIRPQHIHLAEGEPGPSEVRFKAKVIVVEPLGDVALVTIEKAQSTLKMLIREDEARRIEPGQVINAAFERERAYIIDRLSELVLT